MISRIGTLINKRKYLPVFAALSIYIIITLINFRSVIPGFRDRILGAPGDSVGLMWLNSATHGSTWWHYTSWSNFPIGENLWQPVYIVSQAFYIPYGLISKILGPVGGYNFIVSIGFIFSAMVMFLFLRWLTREKYFIAPLIGGTMVAFTPYLQIKTTVHPSYVFNGVFTLLLWTYFKLINSPKNRYFLMAGLLLGFCGYVDPYFLLLGFILSFAFVAGVILVQLKGIRRIMDKSFLRKICLILLPSIIVVLLPLLIIYGSSRNQINTFVSDSRGSSLQDAHAFGARPWEYLIPEVHNPFVPDKIKRFQYDHFHGSNYAETGLYIGLSVLVLSVVGFYFLLRTRQQVEYKIENKILLYTMVSLVIIAGLFSLPPYFSLLGHKIYLPSMAIIIITSIWRVFARLVLLVQIGLVVLATVGIVELIKRLKVARERVLFQLLVGLILGVEFFSIIPVWSFSGSQLVYQKVKNDNNIKAIAEYPLLDPPKDRYYTLYFAYQQIHRKPMVNSALPNSTNEPFRNSLANLDNWQTLPVLHSMGVDAIVVHSERLMDPGKFLGASVDSFSTDIISKDYAWLYKITETGKLSCVTVPGIGFDAPSNTTYRGAEYYMHKVARLDLTNIPGNKGDLCSGPKKLKIDLYTFEKQPRKLDISQRGKVIWSGITEGNMQHQTITLDVDSSKDVTLTPVNPPHDFSLVISKMIAN